MVRNNLVKLYAIALHRVNALQGDGYIIISELVHTDSYFVKLRHAHYAKFITLNCDFSRDQMTQRTNGKVTYSGNIAP